MYRDAYQRGLLTIFYSCGSKPLNIWDTYTQDGYITKFLDEDIRSTVLEIGGTNVSTTYMICPKGKAVLGITMPFLVMVVKNLKKYFSFEVTILDDTSTRRRFRVSNFQSTTQILPLCTVMPIALSEGWNQIQFNMSDFCRRAYKKQFVEVQKFKINANIRVRRIYFADRIFPEDQLPVEYKLFIPLKQRPQDKQKTDEKVGEPEKEIVELKKKDSKLMPAAKLTKSASIVKAVSEVKEFEKTSSRVIEEDVIKSASELPVEGDIAAEEPVAQLEEPVDQAEKPVVQAEEPVVQAEEPVVQAKEPVVQAEEPVVQAEQPVTEESVAQVEEPIAQNQETAAEVESGADENKAVPNTPVATEDAATDTLPEKTTSVEAQTQTDDVTILEEVPGEDKTTETQKDAISKSGSNLEPIAE